ncbi:hypothetical protein DACRYDRAFT_109075 [Dacryopinax primogenitus]|uniref:Uncharacterized protein n=1 Tax=Dacryopinax primogenitus (strain DJM 731) TaxID=1858805 RepID=M5G385_DACPD|nr:uncharacterized protein DACRYDRAFT_109075 [Dacryopinax primogenitus]EJU00337.1 hypothetical protein DACRYDRAFT_109075 [Dacryopinax primogenitus]
MVNFKEEHRRWLLERLPAFGAHADKRQGKKYASSIATAFRAHFPDYAPKRDVDSVDQQIYIFLKNSRAHAVDFLQKLSVAHEKHAPLINQARELMVTDIPNFADRLAEHAVNTNKPVFQARPEFLKSYWENELSEERRREYQESAERRREQVKQSNAAVQGTRGAPDTIFNTIATVQQALQARSGWVFLTLAGGLDMSGARTATLIDTGRTPSGLRFSEFHLRYDTEIHRTWVDFVKTAGPHFMSNTLLLY